MEPSRPVCRGDPSNRLHRPTDSGDRVPSHHYRLGPLAASQQARPGRSSPSRTDCAAPGRGGGVTAPRGAVLRTRRATLGSKRGRRVAQLQRARLGRRSSAAAAKRRTPLTKKGERCRLPSADEPPSSEAWHVRPFRWSAAAHQECRAAAAAHAGTPPVARAQGRGGLDHDRSDPVPLAAAASSSVYRPGYGQAHATTRL